MMKFLLAIAIVNGLYSVKLLVEHGFDGFLYFATSIGIITFLALKIKNSNNN